MTPAMRVMSENVFRNATERCSGLVIRIDF